LKGKLSLEDFRNLEELNCEDNCLTELRLSKNKHLVGLNCSNNALKSLNLSKNDNLKSLNCFSNKLNDTQIISEISSSKNLIYLNLGSNDFLGESFDFLREFTNLEELHLANNRFAGSLNNILREENELRFLDVSSTSITIEKELLISSKLREIRCNDSKEEDGIEELLKNSPSLFSFSSRSNSYIRSSDEDKLKPKEVQK